MTIVATEAGDRPLPKFASDILSLHAAGHRLGYTLYAGEDAHLAALEHRIASGPGTACALLDATSPGSFRYPPAQYVTVDWFDTSPEAYARKLALARALFRDGVRYASFRHGLDWPNIWLAATDGSIQQLKKIEKLRVVINVP
ncbi:MAG TPA: hypothetical protein VKM35_11510 [Arenimonas sp.]|uniref:hypothetical protein n=1 Tax=Arenimonas sp. TaxID=1872635 RepID=UPI002C9675EB|nr:hypothetical protein [Arenimonas sp.]HMB57819.1 hypothetical protein [Arenimonas sp.]